MRKADRLLQIIQVLRRRRVPTTAEQLAEELEVTPRTIYRDVAALQASRVPIEGQAGMGYLLRPGYDLPPLMFGAEELEAVALGARMVADRGDPDLARAAENVLAKVTAVLPDRLADQMWRAALMVPHRSAEAARFGEHLPLVRQAAREQRKIRVFYVDAEGATTTRILWPLGLYFFSHITLVYAWCELRSAFRAFRGDRIKSCELLEGSFDARRGALLREFLSERNAGQAG